jgi:hypothetical protein
VKSAEPGKASKSAEKPATAQKVEAKKPGMPLAKKAAAKPAKSAKKKH